MKTIKSRHGERLSYTPVNVGTDTSPEYKVVINYTTLNGDVITITISWIAVPEHYVPELVHFYEARIGALALDELSLVNNSTHNLKLLGEINLLASKAFTGITLLEVQHATREKLRSVDNSAVLELLNSFGADSCPDLLKSDYHDYLLKLEKLT